ncbi:hypothetical protein [Thiobacillus sp.]|uniref:hypothetical protein n=1 Tax=Thiobacillus sp. TaxID=924 RepID=UPI0025FFB77A|nr:hypothetical protein [Thiobacillus sp.]
MRRRLSRLLPVLSVSGKTARSLQRIFRAPCHALKLSMHMSFIWIFNKAAPGRTAGMNHRKS